MEPTIYKPSIYKGAGIYKTGAEGGGGGESWRDWFEELPRLGYKISTVQFTSPPLMTKLNIDCRIETKHIHILGSGISEPDIIYVYSNQGSDNWTPALSIDSFLTGPKRIKVEYRQPWNGYENPSYNFEWSEGQTLEYIGQWSKDGFSFSINGTEYSSAIAASVSSSWYVKQIQIIHNGIGDSQMYFYYTKVYDENDELIMNFIPVKRKVDGVLGVLETKTGLFASGSNLSEG